MAILDIRGTHGSGKSWVVHSLLKPHTREAIKEDGIQLGYWLKELDTVVVGKYETDCGGCDGIKTADEVVRRVRKFASDPRFRNVVLEGILVSHSFKRYSQLALEIPDYKFLFLDTPLDVCISRVRSRRQAGGNSKPLDPKHLTKDWHAIWERIRVKCLEAGHYAGVLNHKNPMPVVLSLLRGSHGNI